MYYILICAALQCSAEDHPDEQEESCWQPGTLTDSPDRFLLFQKLFYILNTIGHEATWISSTEFHLLESNMTSEIHISCFPIFFLLAFGSLFSARAKCDTAILNIVTLGRGPLSFTMQPRRGLALVKL